MSAGRPAVTHRPERVVIAHNPVAPGDDLATSDVLAQVELVAAGLRELGIPFSAVAVAGGRPWEVLPPAANGGQGLVVFNLVESPTGASWVHTANAAALESLGLPFTGSSAAAFQLTTDKLATRALLAALGLPIAPGGRLDPAAPEVLDRVPPPWILKPAWEDASLGLEDDPVVTTREAALARAAALLWRFPGQPVLAEAYLPGREINVSLLPRAGGDLEVLPVAEMVFVDFPPDQPRVLGYDAKWHTDSFAYTHTVRRFLDPTEDGALIERSAELARAACRACGVAGYARVDLRLDAGGEPCILEVNASPCIAADSGFMAAAGEAGFTAAQVVERILATTLRPVARAEGAAPSPLSSPSPDVLLRDDLRPSDRPALEALIVATGFFNADEREVAMELIDDRLSLGTASHYRFLVGEVGGEVAGYACWGPIAGTLAAADLYWIAIDPRFQRQHVGAALLAAGEQRMAAEGRTRIYVETSTRAQYDPTRRFYAARGYHLAAELADFYAPGDGKAMFLKVL
ncbi:MAG TPA: GNAT family N-acetyltransferase [Thermoanaerobaculia bacterium]|nr:GNAT family N-acetyltransferase [Thermoanaerobaculia bacterium]